MFVVEDERAACRRRVRGEREGKRQLTFVAEKLFGTLYSFFSAATRGQLDAPGGAVTG